MHIIVLDAPKVQSSDTKFSNFVMHLQIFLPRFCTNLWFVRDFALAKQILQSKALFKICTCIDARDAHNRFERSDTKFENFVSLRSKLFVSRCKTKRDFFKSKICKGIKSFQAPCGWMHFTCFERSVWSKISTLKKC